MSDVLEDSLQRTASDWGTGYIMNYEGVSLDEHPGMPLITVIVEKVQDAALTFQGSRVTVLNFASGVNPGGGVRYGAVAQEEDLCRCSGLLHSLEALPDFYEANRQETAPAECFDWMIVSEDVPLVRDGNNQLVTPTRINVLTYPAPNLNRGVFGDTYFDPNFASEDKGGELDVEGVRAIFDRRCAHIMYQANLLKTEVLVLGAWGCGEYGNDATLVANSFKKAISRYGGDVPQVVFACWGYSPNRKAFERVFGDSPQ